ncbi:hypothetical protein [Petrachloros mirabilis]
MKSETDVWLLAGWICVALLVICSWQLFSAFYGAHVPHLVGWFEGALFSLVAADTCFDFVEEDHA